MRYEVKDLIQAAKDGDVNVIAHQANCFCAMKSGIAPQIVSAFPETRIADDETERGDRDKLGTCSMAQHLLPTDEYLTIFNLYGQYSMGTTKNHTDYLSLRKALHNMGGWLNDHDKVGMPKIGCGLAGGDWSIVSEIIADVLDDVDVTIYVLDENEIPEQYKEI